MQKGNKMAILKKILVAGFLFMFTFSIVAAEKEMQQASQVVSDFQTKLLSVMQQDDLNFDARFEQLKPMVIQTHDLAKMTRIVISKQWRSLEKEQKQQLINHIARLSIASYAHYFKSYSGEIFKIESVKQLSPAQIYVHSFLVLPNDNDVSMDYLLKKKGDGWRIINIITNGVSDLALKRSEYGAVLKKSGFEVLLAEISAKIEKFSQ